MVYKLDSVTQPFRQRLFKHLPHKLHLFTLFHRTTILDKMLSDDQQQLRQPWKDAWIKSHQQMACEAQLKGPASRIVGFKKGDLIVVGGQANNNCTVSHDTMEMGKSALNG